MLGGLHIAMVGPILLGDVLVRGGQRLDMSTRASQIFSFQTVAMNIWSSGILFLKAFQLNIVNGFMKSHTVACFYFWSMPIYIQNAAETCKMKAKWCHSIWVWWPERGRLLSKLWPRVFLRYSLWTKPTLPHRHTCANFHGITENLPS